MKSKLLLQALFVFILATAEPCHALMELEFVSKERAKALGVIVRSKPVGASVYVWIEFKAAGELKHFSHAQLAFTAGDRSLSTTLLPERSTPDSVVVFFSADPETLRACEVTVAVHLGERTNVGHVFKMKDFIELVPGAKKAGADTVPRHVAAGQTDTCLPPPHELITMLFRIRTSAATIHACDVDTGGSC